MRWGRDNGPPERREPSFEAPAKPMRLTARMQDVSRGIWRATAVAPGKAASVTRAAAVKTVSMAAQAGKTAVTVPARALVRGADRVAEHAVRRPYRYVRKLVLIAIGLFVFTVATIAITLMVISLTAPRRY